MEIRINSTLVLFLILATAGFCIASPTIIYQGKLSSDWDAVTNPGVADGGIEAAGTWAGGEVTLEWTVSRDETATGIAGWWHYQYQLTIPSSVGAISHMTLERSAGSEDSDFANFLYLVDGDEPGDVFYLLENSNTDGVGAAAIKFETNVDGSDLGHVFAVDFWSQRNPIWGDFYAKDGVYQNQPVKIFNSAWNEGLSDTDPIVGPSSGSVNSHLLVPDTTIIPAPGAFVLGSIGAGLLGWLRRRRVL